MYTICYFSGECRFCFPDEAVISFENGIFRVADFECPRTEGDDKDHRILDMCFIRRDTRPHLIIIDADNMKVKFLSVLGNVCIDGHTFSNLNKRPNRLSKINEDSFALIYENNLDIAIFNIIDKDLILTRTLKIKVITKLPNSEQSYKGKVKTHNYINRQNQSTTGKL